ncbi:SusC/RagA family TonB-linked outer membrane protein [Saccharicrinis sp. GN24d3]|uniref:SusC/RagA family TonB-linked outer membrane protein n=1 Tax=Saccharicrinis sp. GN24d3 TaxID=3458416 RepID=UPI004036DAD7
MKKNRKNVKILNLLNTQYLKIASLTCLGLFMGLGTLVAKNGLHNIGAATEMQQTKDHTVTGVVTDETGSPLPGVTIIVKGTTMGIITDMDGKYSLTNLNGTETLVFSFVGMLSEEVAIENKTIINIQLIPDAIGIEEVVAIGYGVQKKRDVSSAIASVDAEVFKDRPVANFAQGISGSVAGVSVSQTNGAPGGGSNIVIRGLSSVNASNAPLYVLDGQPLPAGFSASESPINFINPDDIQSIEILKDAASSAIYGTRAANGVVLITTKSGKKGKTKVSVSLKRGVQEVLRKYDALNRDDFLQYYEDSRANAYLVEDPNLGSDDPNAPLWSRLDSDETRIANWMEYSRHASAMQSPTSKHYRWITVSDELKDMPYDTDWQDEFFGTGSVTDAQISFSGGTDNLTYYVSGGIYLNDGMIKSTGYDRYGFRSKIEQKVNNWLTIGLNLAPTIEKTDVLHNSTSTSGSNNPLLVAAQLAPIFPTHNEDGTFYRTGMELNSPWDWNVAFLANPLTFADVTDQRKTARLNSKFYTDITLMKDLVWKSSFNHNLNYRERNFYLPSFVPTSSKKTQPNEGRFEYSSSQYWDVQSFLTYKKNIGNHSISAMAGFSMEESSYNSAYIRKYEFAQDIINTLNQGTLVKDMQNDARTNKNSQSMIGSFARASYNYASKYYLTASVRRDGSSKFGLEKKWAVFPSFSVAWRISDESFFSPLNAFVGDMKLRAGWGKIGNSGITNYLAIADLGSATYPFGAGSDATTGYYNSKIPNPTLGWETTKDLSFGVDLSLFDSRISVSADYFERDTEDMLFNRPLPLITGHSSVMQNLGSMTNKGFEYLLTTRNFEGEFTWTTTATLSYYRNMVTNIGSDKRPIVNNSGYTTEGRPLAGLWGVHSLGAYSDWEDVKTNPIYGSTKTNWANRSQPGSPKSADVNGDGILDDSDKTVLGNATPDFIWGLSNIFSYKGFDMSFKLTGRQGGEKMMTQDYNFFLFRGQGRSNTTYDYFNNYWTEDNPNAKYPAPNRKSYDSNTRNLTGGLLFDASYILCENIALGYTLPGKITKKASISRARIYVSLDNAFLVSDYPGYNPMGNYKGDSALSQGVDRTGDYPLPRTLTFGINLDF